MPVKNTEQYLVECLDSICNQSETHWELVAVNDHSTDKSNTILEEYALKDARIKVLQNNGNGIIDALRLAFSESNGTFITRMDSDDIMRIHKIKVLKNNLMNYGEGHVATGLVNYISENKIGEGYQKYEAWLNRLTKEGNNFKEIYKECVIPSPCWMVYKNDLLTCNAFQPNFYPEDYDLTFRFYIQGIKPIPCNEILHYWRDYPTRTSRTDEHYSDHTFLDIKAHYFLKQEYDPEKNLVIWGAGAKGKSLAKKMIEKNIPFYWICDNPKKIGKHIYDQKIYPFKELESIENAQSIITVANPREQEIITHYFNERGAISMKDFFFFC
ncbi:MAG: glycosyltransferase involved in cell wall biosynthesis [Flavobacteriaceae bacterium]|jgi:glycosyltransferase involved in cell wall biosynthesis